MKHLIVHTFLLFLILPFKDSFGQISVDSLKQTIREAKTDSVKIRGYNLLCSVYFSKNNFISRRYADSTIALIDGMEPKLKTKKFFQLQSSFAFEKIAGLLYQQGKYNECLEYCLKAHRINEIHNTQEKTATSLGNIGGVLKAIGSKEALGYYARALNIHQDLYKQEPDNKSFKMSLASSYHNFGATYAYFSNYDSSMYCFRKALSLVDSTKKSGDVAIFCTGIAQAYKMGGKYKEALTYNRKAFEIYEKIGSPDGLVSAYNGFADIYLYDKDYKNAIRYSELAEELSIKNNFSDDILYSYETRFLVYEEMNDIKNQLIFLKKHSKLKDSLSVINHTLQIEELKTQYETEKKENQIVKLNANNKIQELQLEKDAATKTRLMVILISVIVVVLLLVWLAFFLAKIIQERKKAYIKLQEKNIEIQKQGEKLNEQSKLISKYQSQMNPHFVFNALNSIQGSILNDDKNRTIDRLQLLSQLMRQTLNNSENDSITLEAEINYLKTYVEFEKQKLGKNLKFEIEYPADYTDILIPPMMIQPFIENAIKHAGLQHLKDACITLKIVAEDDLLKIFIKDNGEGFDAKDTSFLKNSHALKIIQSRLQLLFMTEKKSNNIFFEIKSKPVLERGTEIKFYLPLNYKY